MMTSREIRQSFLDFFKSKGHQIVPSAPIVIKNDPTLMFTNAGMNQFKDIFLGNISSKYKRVADTQKCLRVSGKHNDLEDVGLDTYHHTMFEMLGNWSFGDYFKKEAIEWAWELLTKVWKLPKERIYVTYFQGDAKEKLSEDKEAYDEWKKWIGEERILKGNKKDNFWEMDDTGPCGPCSEIHYDMRSDAERKKTDGRELVNKDNPQVIEIWNLVFIQFNRKADGSLENLPQKHVDTGMGFERICAVIQNPEHSGSNYDTDVFTPLIYFLEKDVLKNRNTTDEKVRVAIRIVSDHIRAVSFAIADGQLPSNTGAGYVVRRILRRAIRYGHSFFGVKEPFMFELVDTLVEKILGDVFHELRMQKDFIKRVIKEEETNFFTTLENGEWKLRYFFQNAYHDSFPLTKAESIESHRKKIVPGELCFNLYDTNGFPFDLTKLIAKEQGFEVDEKGFEIEMQKQKERSRKATAVETSDWQILDSKSQIQFVGYDSLECEAKIIRYRKVSAKGKNLFHIVLDKTPFYAEAGGQVGDIGLLIPDDGSESVRIIDTQKENELIIHIAESLPKNLNVNFLARVDGERRGKIMCNHTATHLLNAALKIILGKHVDQKGSLVAPGYLRFDFSHFAKVSDEELKNIESLINEKISADIQQDTKEYPIEEARKLGATAVFGEKYGERMRVVTFNKNFSMEFCGGTHVKSTAEIGCCKIISESSVAAGVRRIEAITSNAVRDYLKNEIMKRGTESNNLTADIDKLAERIKKYDVKYEVGSMKYEKVNSGDNVKELECELENKNSLLTKLGEKKKELERKLQDVLQKDVDEYVGNADLKIKTKEGISFIIEMKKPFDSAEQIRNTAFRLKNKFSSLVFLCGAEINGKPQIALMISENLVKEKGWKANEIIKTLAKEIQGGGGGQEFFATAGGKDASGLWKVEERAKELFQK